MTNPTTLTDRQWLWRVHGLLGVTATTPAHQALLDELWAYLRDTCTHDWTHVPAEDYSPDPATAPDLVQCSHCYTTRPYDTATPITTTIGADLVECAGCSRPVPEVPTLTLAPDPYAAEDRDPGKLAPRWWCEDCIQAATREI